MKGLFKLFILLAVVFVVSSIFNGGDYIRLIGVRTGINLHAVADVADVFRLETFMTQKSREQRAKEKNFLSN